MTEYYLNKDELNKRLAERFLLKTTDEWMVELEANGVLCAHVNTFVEAADDPQVLANKMVIEIPHDRAGSLRVLGTPLRLHSTPPSQKCQPPDLGADSAAVLSDLGYDEERINDLLKNKIIGA